MAPLRDAFVETGVGFGWTYSEGFPVLRIDHLFVDPRLGVLECEVLGAPESDHRAVRAVLQLR